MLSSIKAVILSGREYTLLILSLLLRICLEGKCLMKDKRFSALYGLEAGKNLKGAVSGYMDNVKTIEVMKGDMSRIDTLREAVKTDGIAAPMTESNLENIRDAEGKIMDKAKADNKAKRSMSLDVSFGTAKSHSLSEERTIQAEGSTLHAKDTLTVKSGEDMTVKGSQMSAEEVYLKAGKDIRILSVENSSTAREKENASSASLGGSIGSSGLNGIRASYGRGRKEGKSEEISHTESTIKADYTLSLESGRDTILKGSRIEGEKLQADAGGSLSMESEQDRKTYRENGKNTGISLGYDILSGKVSGFATAGKSHTDSDYESVTDQADIYAGDKGFDITVKDNTHLKGAVIDSKGSAGKNTLRTGTLSWEDVENKADYKAGGMGISYAPKDSTIPLNARGLTPQMSPTVKDKADSTTKAAIAKGTIVITDKKNQGRDISTLHRDTENSLNRLKEIFDKSKVEGKQELLGMMEKYGNQAIHAYAESRGWKDGSAEKVLLHGAFGALMGDMGTGETLAGALSGSIHEYVMGYLNRTKSPEWVRTHPDAVEWLSAGLGTVIGKASDASISGMADISLDAAKWNDFAINGVVIKAGIAVKLSNAPGLSFGHVGMIAEYANGQYVSADYGRYGNDVDTIGSLPLANPVGKGTFITRESFNPDDKYIFIFNPKFVDNSALIEHYNAQIHDGGYHLMENTEVEEIFSDNNAEYYRNGESEDYRLLGHNCVTTSRNPLLESVKQGTSIYYTLYRLKMAETPDDVYRALMADYEAHHGEGLVQSVSYQEVPND